MVSSTTTQTVNVNVSRNTMKILAVPKDNGYNNVFLKLCNIHVDQIHSELSESCSQLSFSESEIEKAIDKLHNGKSPDEYGIAAKHF